MSILNVGIEPGFAVVATDTLMSRQGGAALKTTKTLALPHIGAVIAGRGQVVFLNSVYGSALLHAESFEHFAELAPRILAETLSRLKSHFPGFSDRQQIALVGYSSERGSMVGYLYQPTEGGDGFAREEIENLMVTPFARPMMEPASLATIEAMVDVARQQHSTFPADGDECPTGGELIVTIVRADAITMRVVHRFSERAVQREATGAA